MKKFLLFTVVLMFATAALFAQGVTTASMSGLITDTKGEPVAGATIQALHVPTGTNYTTSTRGDGRFNLPNLRIGGPYTVKVSFIGFQTYSESEINLTIGQDYKLNVKITDNATALREVVVTGTQNKVINASRSGTRETITRSQIDRLPTISRSLSDYTKLTPSANSTAVGGNSFGGRGTNANNLTVDGALFNNTFGLAGSLGGQTNSQPISLDAIEQIQVDLSPYDITQGRFTGAGINTVTKSGTNQFKGTAYGYWRGADLVGRNTLTTEVPKPTVDYHVYGVSLGGPIIKNKLFFFVSGEQERNNDPATSLQAAQAGQVTGGNIARPKQADMDQLSSFLTTKYGYDPGAYQNYNLRTNSDRIAAKLDWNINSKNSLSLKYFYLKSFRDVPPSASGALTSRSPGALTLPFFSSYYTINNNFNIGIAELNSRISAKFSNKLTVGYQALRDFRSSPGGSPFPLVDILESGSTLTSFGYEPFTAFNLLNTDTWQFSDNFQIFAGKHEFTVGAAAELNKFRNGFAPSYYGYYRFNSLTDFYNSANTGLTNAARYDFRYSALPDASFPYADVKVATYSLYGQDKWQIKDNFRLTYGVRFDLPTYNTTSQANPNAAALTFRDGQHVDVAKYPDAKIQFSPRAGFNWDIKNDQSIQLRGGLGLFVGPPPYVYISNQASNNGVQFGSYSIQPGTGGVLATDPRLAFNPNVDANRPAAGSGIASTSYNLAVTDPDFKFPKLFKANLAVDKKLPWGIIGTLEGSFSKDINGIMYQNINLPSTGAALAGSDNRIRYSASQIYGSIPAAQGGNTAQNPNISDVTVLSNTNKGYTYFVTAQVQKTISAFYFSLAYTHSDSRTVNDGGSIAQSTWRDRVVSGDPNADVTSYSNFYMPNRVIATASYRKEYAKYFATSVGLTFESANNGVSSYTYSGDLNGDAQTSNDLIYVPKTSVDIVLVPDNTDPTKGAVDSRTPAQIWAQLDSYIKQDEYLHDKRGEYAKRNGVVLPYFNNINLNLSQDFFVKAGTKRNTIRVEFNIINFTNFLNKDWGVYRVLTRPTLLTYKGLEAGTGKPTFSFPYLDSSNQIPLTNSYTNLTTQLSRWQAQIGLRYIFN
ncbi:TonB-dependent receptor plug domain-containing protein [Pedobacter sp. HMF7647]|uniref:TonB-dependent receptor plug domain-containing protein n=1 Tax=Hufsiella arboris TaxID=2695275 RepID=A0A7K1YCL4_9SPHI|nr:TonB-dependent receptor [Hufsiella arboris]MXV52327.1 TonB-dependent receptor plug domain-containing protein [Hufsiella arboris]